MPPRLYHNLKRELFEKQQLAVDPSFQDRFIDHILKGWTNGL